MAMQDSPATRPSSPTPSPRAYRVVLALVGGYVGLSILTVGALALLSRYDPAQASAQAWTRGTIVAATSVLTLVFAIRASRGQPRALLRLRIVLVVILVAIVAVLVFLALPTWMVLEQALCGVLLLVSALLVFTSRGGDPGGG